MQFQGIEIVCPACRHDLVREGDDLDGRLDCASCGGTYPILAGIPDLRVFPDPYIGFDDDRRKGQMLSEHAAQLDFAASVRFYYSVTEKVPPFQAQRFERGLLAAAARARYSLERWERDVGGDPATETLLEIGCGTAPLLQAAVSRYARVVGIDIAFRWLVLARRRLADAGMEAPLLCACAEALPFPDGVFDRVVADSAIEHLRAPDDGVRECARVLRDGGWIMGATPNRFSLGPDPHVGLPAGGYLPNGMISMYVRRKGGIPPQRQLQSIGSLRRLLEASGFEDITIWAPEVPAQQTQGFGAGVRTGVRLYNTILGVAPARYVLGRVGPLLHVVARRGTLTGDSALPVTQARAGLHGTGALKPPSASVSRRRARD